MGWRKFLPSRRLLGSAGFALLGFGLNLYWTFPADALAERLVYEAQQRSNGSLQLSFAKASTWRLSGLRLTDVSLQRRGNGDAPPMVFHLDSLQARLQVVPLLLGRQRLVARATQADGLLTAWINPGQQFTDLEVGLTDWSLAQPALAEALELSTGGTLSGELSTHWEADPLKCTGELQLEFKQASVGPGRVVGMSLPAIGFGEISLALKLAEGQLRIHSFHQQGGVLAAQARGSLQLKAPWMMSILDLCATVQPTPEFLAAQPKLATALQIAGAQLRRDKDGTLHVPLGGTLLQPRLSNAPCH
jgi:type II secretion system protein N